MDLERSIGRALMRMVEASRKDLSLSDDIERSAQLLVEEGCRLLPDIQCRITVVPADRPDTLRLLAVAGAGPSRPAGQEWPMARTPTRRALEAGGPVERTVGAEDPDQVLGVMPAPVITVRAVPVGGSGSSRSSRSSLGAFLVLRPGDEPFADAEREVIDAYAELISVALVRAELRRESVDQSRRLGIGVEVAVDLALSPEPDDVVRRLLERATEAVDADRAALARVERATLITEGAHDVDGRPVVQGIEFPLEGHPLARKALETGRPVLGGGADLRLVPPELRESFRDIRHTALLPLLFGGDVVGLLTVSRRRDPGFSDGDLKTLQIIGNVAVLALRNARLYAEAQSAVEGMSSLVDLVVHELRSPLTVIAGYIDMMTQRPADQRATWDGPLQIVGAKIAEMQSLVDELVLSARLAGGAIPAATTALDLRDSVAGAVNRAEPRRHMVEAVLDVHLPPGPAMVICEPSGIDHILDNLINNALSHGGLRPRICVSVELGPAGTRVVVEDSGPGISADLHERVFERFFRVNPLPGQPGSGLGLHISRQLATQSRGSLDLDRSEPGRGSRFVLRLPSAPQPPPALAEV